MLTFPLPESARAGLGDAAPPTLHALGNPDLLQIPLLGLLCSRQCPGGVILETLDRVPEWVKTGCVIVSGFHAPLEQQVLCSLLRRAGRAVKVLARTLDGYRPSPQEREALAGGRLLLLSSFPPTVRRTTREAAITRNRLVAALCQDLYVPYCRESGPLADLVGGKP